MAVDVPSIGYKELLAVLREAASPLSVSEIAARLEHSPPRRTLQARLQKLSGNGIIIREGVKRGSKYRLAEGAVSGSQGSFVLPLGKEAQTALNHVAQPIGARAPVGYDRAFLDEYIPGHSRYLPVTVSSELQAPGRLRPGDQEAGTYAKQILQRLLVDLAWNSSRLEGNTYSLLDTRRLIAFGEMAEGKDAREAQMILNHKDAIEFLVRNAAEIGFNRYTILNLHALLANNLLPDPAAPGRLRQIAVGIESSSFHPLEVPGLIEECFDTILAKAAAIADPLEQSLFALTQLPYLQPFEDVNKRVARLAANIPLIRANLAPLSFEGVPQDLFVRAMLAVYELRDVAPVRDIFVFAYRRSVQSYAAVRQSLGEPDPFRLTYRDALAEVVADIVSRALSRSEAVAAIRDESEKRIPPIDRETFRRIVEDELLALHEGNFARYRIRPSEFAAWKTRWDAL